MTKASDPTGSEEIAEHQMSEGEIDETLEASFPASDPPQWTLGMETHAHPNDAAETDDNGESSTS